MIVLAFYKYVEINKLNKLKEDLIENLKKQGMKGRILIGKEGINGSVAGTREQADWFIDYLRQDSRFEDIAFKEQECISVPFAKTVVKIKDEIVRFGKPVDLKKTGKHLNSDEFLKACEEQDVIILDARNDYEWKVGKFRNALTFPIKTFRQFPEAIKQIEDKKDKKIVMYCTGGIRCEKASAYLVEQGFKDVSQLNGGILKFCNEKPSSNWEGSCFVFDKRLVSNFGDAIISSCEGCSKTCDLYRNCKKVDCDRYVILCPECDMKFQGYCSEDCLRS